MAAGNKLAPRITTHNVLPHSHADERKRRERQELTTEVFRDRSADTIRANHVRPRSSPLQTTDNKVWQPLRQRTPSGHTPSLVTLTADLAAGQLVIDWPILTATRKIATDACG